MSEEKQDADIRALEARLALLEGVVKKVLGSTGLGDTDGISYDLYGADGTGATSGLLFDIYGADGTGTTSGLMYDLYGADGTGGLAGSICALLAALNSASIESVCNEDGTVTTTLTLPDLPDVCP